MSPNTRKLAFHSLVPRSFPVHWFPIHSFPQFKGFQTHPYFSETTSFPQEMLQNLPSLESLVIYNCHALQSLPQNLPSLKSLDIESCNALQSLPDLGSSSLEKLSIQNCESLSSISPGLRCQTTLHSLTIWDCPKAEISTMEYQHLTSLESLSLFDFPDMTSLPNGLQHLSSTLRKLRISWWSALNSLPDWIGTFTNLESLTLYSCENLRDLPDELKNLTNLGSLTISKCHPELHGRCEKETGEAWPKIAHIPQIYNYLSTWNNGRNSQILECFKSGVAMLSSLCRS